MKKITLFAAFLVASLGYSQIMPFDFEDGENPFSANTSIPTIITDPTDANNMVMQLDGKGGQYDNAISNLAQYIDLSDDANNTITFRIKPMDNGATDTRNHLLKFELKGEGAGAGAAELAFTTTGTDWQNISLDFGAGLGNYGRIVLFTDFNATSTGVYLFDDFAGGTNIAPPAAATPPSTAAPTPPTRDAANVISLFSDAYALTPRNFDAGWCGTASITEVMIAGNNTVQYNGNECQGIVLTDAVDASSFTHMHVDVYIDETDFVGKVFNLKFVQQPGGAALEVNFNQASNPPLVGGQWISIDVEVDLSNFTSLKEFGITNNNKNNSWYDNLYFYKEATASVNDELLANVSVSPNPATTDLRISAKAVISNVKVYNVLGKEVKVNTLNETSVSRTLDVSNLNTGIYIVKYSIDNAVGTSKFIKK